MHYDQPLIQSALRDDNKAGDIAYIGLAAVTIATIGPIFIMAIMSMVAHFRCTPTAYLVKETLTVIECKYDPLPLGTAIGLAASGFAAGLIGLAAYMAATRPPRPAAAPQQPSPVNVTNIAGNP